MNKLRKVKWNSKREIPSTGTFVKFESFDEYGYFHKWTTDISKDNDYALVEKENGEMIYIDAKKITFCDDKQERTPEETLYKVVKLFGETMQDDTFEKALILILELFTNADNNPNLLEKEFQKLCDKYILSKFYYKEKSEEE